MKSRPAYEQSQGFKYIAAVVKGNLSDSIHHAVLYQLKAEGVTRGLA